MAEPQPQPNLLWQGEVSAAAVMARRRSHWPDAGGEFWQRREGETRPASVTGYFDAGDP